MKSHHVRVYPSKEKLAKDDQLAWKIAQVAADSAPVDSAAQEMVINRLIDNAAVAIAAINRTPPTSARQQALAFPRKGGATLFGVPSGQTFSPEWAAWANGTAVRELDFHDTFLAADYSHPGDNIPPVLAVAQQMQRSGLDLIRGILTAYEIQIDLVRSVCLHEYKKDHIAHLCPAQAAGIGTLLKLDADTIYQAVQQAVHVSFQTRQSRKGEISSWKAYAPSFSGKMAVEAADRAMRGETSPSPIYEGEESVIAWMLGSKEYDVSLPAKGESKHAILDSYTKEHSAEYQAQAIIDLAFKMRPKIKDVSFIKDVLLKTSYHTHNVIGSGSNDPQKYDPRATRETLDHSVMYIFAVALQDGVWHHVDSYSPKRASRQDTVELWKKIRTQEDKRWTDLYHHPDPNKKGFGGQAVITFKDGKTLTDELLVANAHPNGAKPFQRKDYIRKFETLTAGIIAPEESKRFLAAVQQLSRLKEGELDQLNIALPAGKLAKGKKGIFDA